jgi:hypothetical protein
MAQEQNGSSEYDAFTRLVDRVLKVPHSEIMRREAEYKRRAAKANPVKHEPCGLLGYADCPVKLPRANPIPVAANHPHCRKPLVQTERGILENGPDLDGELALGVLVAALPSKLVFQEPHPGLPQVGQITPSGQRRATR